MTLEEMHSRYYMDHMGWEQAWREGLTDWWPDSLPLPGAKDQGARCGDPSSPMPDKARDRVIALRARGEQYVTHVDTGVHAYRIGFWHEYLGDVP